MPCVEVANTMTGIEAKVGERVSLTLSSGEAVEGEVYALEEKFKTLILSISGDRSYRLINTDCVAEVRVLAAPQSPWSPEGAEELLLPSREETDKRKFDNLCKAHAESLQIGEGVTREAQDVFNALSRTLRCSWKGDSIVIYDEVIIEAPYTKESCRCLDQKGSKASLERVQKVLEGERSKLFSR